MPSIDGDLLDEAEQELRGRTKADAIHSGALADELGIDDGEANPKTREVIRMLMDERGLPVASANCGYWLIESREQLETYKDNLQSRIQGIQERIEMAERNYEQAIADGGQTWSEQYDEADIRRAIKNAVENRDSAMRADVVDDVRAQLGCDPSTTQLVLEEMVEKGFAYVLESGEVRLP
jgi:hypothetical protein